MSHAYKIDLTDEEEDYLQSLTRQRTIQAQGVDRAKTLLYKAEGMSNGDIADRLDVNINTVKFCLRKYKEGGIQRALFDEDGNIIIPDEGPMVHTVSCGEKPGIQAIATTGDDLRPTVEIGCVYRDYKYKRLGTLSLLAGIDLLTEQAIPLVSETHKSSDFICLLKKFDEIYPHGDVISIICDNHSAHKSKEVQNYLATCPEGRFVFVFTPKHGSWLNLIESFFSKMTKQMLQGIRVNSKRILLKESISISTRLTLIPWSITGLISSTKSLKMKPRAI